MSLGVRKFALILSLLMLASAACTVQVEDIRPQDEDTLQFFPADLGIEVHEDQLSSTQLKAYELFSQKEALDTEEFNHSLTMAVLDQQRREFVGSEQSSDLSSDEIPSTSDFLARIDIRFLNREASNIFELKTSYESQLEEQLQKPLVYNRDHVSVFSATTLGKAQCYSGTMMLEILRRKKNYQEYLNSNPVVIFESGHVLAGYMEFKDGQWNLVGIESTVAGEGRKLYGPVSGLKGVRVVAANYFFAIEAIKFSIANEQHVFEKALTLTADAYGMDLNKLEATISNPLRKMGATEQLTVEEGTAQILNQSMFSFGVSKNVPPGDVTRDQVDTLPPNMIGALNPGQSAIWILEFEEDRDAEIREPSVMDCDEFNLPTTAWEHPPVRCP